MKRKFTFLIAAAVMLLTMVATTGRMWGQSKTETTTTYTFTSKSWTATSGGSAANWTSGQDGGGFNNNGIQVTTSSTGANGTSPISFTNVTKIVATYNTNKSGGAGSIVAQIGTNTATTNSVAYPGSGDGRTGYYTTEFNYTTAQTGTVKITVNTTTNSLYLVSVAITTNDGTSPSISAANVNIAYDATGGSIAYTLTNATGNVTAEITSGDWLTLGTVTENTVPFTCSANEETTARTAQVTLSYIGATDKVVTVTQDAAPNNISDITEVSTAYTVVGTVVATNNKGFVIGDGTGYVYTYLNASPSQAIGDKVKIAGTTGTYGQIIQFTNSATITSSTTSNYNGTPAATVITDVPDYSTGYHLSTYLEFEGALSKSSSNYFITLGESQIQISYPTTAQGTALTALDGKTVHVKGYFSGNNSSGYFSVMMESVEEVTDPTISINPETADPFTYVYGHGPSTDQVFEVTGTNLTSNDIVATITAGADYFEITDDEVYSNTVTVNSGDVISIHMKAGLALNNDYAGVLTLTNEGAENVVVSLTGSVTGATYAIEQYSTPVTAHGTITFAPASPVEEGTEVTLTATPAEGYDFTADSWVFYKEGASDFVVDPSITATDNKITMPAYDIWVDGTFTAKQTYAITCVADPTEGGIIESDPTTAYEGQTVTLSYVPETDYELTSIVITKTSDGSETGITPVASGDNYTFEMPGYAVTATATFVYNPNITYVFSNVDNFYKESTLVNHPTTSSNIAEFYYKNGDRFTASGTSYYFSSSYFLLGKTDALVNLPTFTNYKITQIVLHSSTGHSTSVNVAIVSGDNNVAAGQTWSNKDKDYTYDIPAAYQNSALSVKVTNNYNTQFTSITLVREVKSTDPEINVSTDAITDFSYGEGGGPSVKSFSVNGYNLGTTPITVALGTGTNFGLALSSTAETWNNTVTIDPTEGTVNNVTVYVRMNAGLSIGTYNDNISVTWGSLDESVALSGTVNSAPYNIIYTLIKSINDLTPGYHYIIASEEFAGELSIMGQQSSNNRDGVNDEVVSETITKLSDADYYDFVISGDADNKYTIYDEKNSGFLYAASSSSNYLKTQSTNDANGKWSIAIAENGAATIIAQGSNTRNYMRYNANSNFFSCYAQNSTVNAPVYLYKKTTDTPVYYSTTGITVNNPDFDTNPVTVLDNEILYITGNDIQNTDEANLIIEEGGQLVLPEEYSVLGTLKKSVSHGAKSADNWYTIASPIHGTVDIDDVINLVQTPIEHYDLYQYNEATFTWENSKDTEHSGGFDELTYGRGYLYWNSTGATIEFPGLIHSFPVTYTLTNTPSAGDYAGWNLIGNPYTHDIYKGASGCAITNTASGQTYELATGFYRLSDDGAWDVTLDKISDGTAIKPGEGILVHATTGGTLTMTSTEAKPASSKRDSEEDLFIKFIISNNNYEDAVYALFEKATGLNKINHRNSDIPMVYIPQDGKNFAIATMDDNTEMFNLNFKAATAGQYTLSFNADGKYNYLHVIDRLTGKDVDMLLEGEYNFIGSPRDNEARFIVKLNENANVSTSDDIFAYQNGSDIIVNGEGELQVFDVMGRLVMNTNINGTQTINVNEHGVYIFKLNDKVQKIVVR